MNRGNSDLGRWLSVDPLSDKYYGFSSYNYTVCNPLRYIDPTGMSYEDLENTASGAQGRMQNSSLLSGQHISNDEEDGGDKKKKKDGYNSIMPYLIGTSSLLLGRSDQILGDELKFLQKFVAKNPEAITQLTKLGSMKTATEFLGVGGLMFSFALDVNSYKNGTMNTRQFGINFFITGTSYVAPAVGFGLFIYDKTVGIENTLNNYAETIEQHRKLGIPIPTPGTGF